MKIFIKALAFAAKKHSGQLKRDKADYPYVNHPVAMAELLSNQAGIDDERVLAATLLHDTMEKTDASEHELIQEFGKEIAGIVAELTDDKSLPDQKRKQQQVEHAPALSREAKLVKLADKICNLEDMAVSPPADWPIAKQQEYFDWAKAVVDGLRATHSGLEHMFDETYKRRPKGTR